MSSSVASNNRNFLILTVSVYIAAVAVFSASQGYLDAFTSQKASAQAKMAQNAPLGLAIGRLQLASWLDAGNQGYKLELARLQMKSGDFKQAERTVAHLATPDAQVIKSQAAQEEGSDDAAISAVRDGRNGQERDQLALSYAVASRTQDLKNLSGGEGSATFAAARAGGLALAQELHNHGLFHSALRVLDKAPDSATKFNLMAHAQLALKPSSRSNLDAAKRSASQGATLYPANIDLQVLLRDIDEQLGDTAGVNQQNKRLEQLRSGRLL